MKTSEKILHSVLSQPAKLKDDFSISVLRFFTDANGQTTGAIPTAFNQKIPFYLFNEFDKSGFYKIGQQVNIMPQGMFFLYQSDWGTSFDLFRFNNAGNIYQLLNPGDFVMIYGDDPINFTTLCFIVIRCQNRSYTSMVKYMHLQPVKSYQLLFGTDNILQYSEPINMYHEDSLGKFKFDYFQPFSYKNPMFTKLQDFIRIPLNHSFTAFSGFSSYILPATTQLFMNFLVKI